MSFCPNVTDDGYVGYITCTNVPKDSDDDYVYGPEVFASVLQ